MKGIFRASLSAALLSGGLMATLPAVAEPEDGAKSNIPANTTAPADRSRADHIEGHIAFLHAELGITPAEEGAWQQVAAAMHADVQEYQDMAAKYPEVTPTSPSAIESLEERASFIELRAKGERRFVRAFQPLYTMMPDDQKKKADDMFANHENE